MAADLRPLEEILDPRFDRKMNVHQRLHLAMTLADYVQKDKKEGMKYTIVSHDKVTALARDIFIRTGLIFYPLDGSEKWVTNGNRFELKLAVRIQNIDEPDDNVDVLGFGYGIDPGDKGPGKATSYAVKYALLKALGLETGDDPDQDQDVQHRSSTQQRADELLKNLLTTTDEASLKEVVTGEAMRQVLASLENQDPAEWRKMRGQITKHARSLDVDMAKWKDDPA
jgi:hypothetical protein